MQGDGAAAASEQLLTDVRALEPLVLEAVRGQAFEDAGELPSAVVEELHRLEILRLGAPVECGGPEIDPITQIEVVEELSRQDGSVGWCAMIAKAGSYAAAFLAPATAQKFFGGRESCIAGLIHPMGRAEIVDGGYRVSGRFRFASGSGHATTMIGGCMVFADGELVGGDRGVPQIRVMLMDPSDCKMLDTWHTTGLAGTGSNDYDVDDVFVAADECWNPAGAMLIDRPMYRYPPLFLCPHAGVPLGIARAAIDEVTRLGTHKDLFPSARRDKPGRLLGDDRRTQEAVARAEGTLGAARAYAYATVEELWETLVVGERAPQSLRARYRIMLTHVHEAGRDVVSSMYNTASTDAIYKSSPLDRQFRDIQTACQHRMVNQKIYEPAGRVLLGMPSGDPFI